MGAQWANLLNFLIYIGISLPLMGIGLWLFIKITPYKEFQMIGDGAAGIDAKTAAAEAAAYALGGKVLALAVVLASAIFHSLNPIDFIIWGIVGILFQVAMYYLYEWITPFKVAEEIPKGNIAAGILSAFFSVAAGLLLAALISY
jgi:putative membrane protein